jgi:uncharacterized protein YndB with AHSA1/START domain
MTSSKAPAPVQVFEIYIKATPKAIWEAITKPEWTARYGYRGPWEVEERVGGSYKARPSAEMSAMGLPDVIIDGEVLEINPPNKLVHSYRWLFTEESKAEGFTRVTWEIAETASGFTRLTVTHNVEHAPGMASMIGSQFNEHGSGGWNWILSDLKSLLETGKAMSDA